MKRAPTFIASLVLASLALVGCSSKDEVKAEVTTPAYEAALFSKEWKLAQVLDKDGKDKKFSRAALKGENFYTIRFDAERVSGSGAVNRFTAPYTRGQVMTKDDNAVELGVKVDMMVNTLAATKAASIGKEPLKEAEYFKAVQEAKTLILSASADEARLVSPNTILIYKAQ
ncbi:MAG: META domain-containing protein [Helicobacteraceae bacterium]|jgi:hypothetical protein|nr:META domain-containing protein [Helicobacteraceae bacterium]